MCGISGFCDFTKKLDFNTLKRMTDILHHRGPDDSGYNFYESENIGLGHRRLSILDLSKHGHQPMQFKNLEIVYNGEVYNFKEIRAELEKLDYKFNSDSDTEVIIKAYHQWGIKSIDKFNGMFSIAIYDKLKNKIVLIRDRAGVKPLYYYYENGIFLFSSELKSFYQVENFKKDLDIESVKKYLKFGYISQPNTIFKNTYKLEAGNYLEFDTKKNLLKIFQYWNIESFYHKEKLNISFLDAKVQTKKLLKTSFEYRMISDVPVGIFLSGGYDSSAVASILQVNSTKKIKTFTIGFKEEKYNEAIYAKKVAEYLGTEHYEYYLSQKDALDILPTLADIYDEPFGDSSAIPTIMVSQFAKNYVDVTLSADGGDELFSGYPSYKNIFDLYNKFNLFRKFHLLGDINKLINPYQISQYLRIYNLEGKFYKFCELLKNSDNPSSFYDTNTKYFYDIEINMLLHDEIEIINQYKVNSIDNMLLHDEIEIINQYKVNSIDNMLQYSFKTYLNDDILTKVDRATMSVSLEGREPLLDYRLVEFLSQIPIEYKQYGNKTKYLLKEIVHEYIPEKIMDRKKMGFSIPIFEWFKDELKYYFEEYLSEKNIKESNIFDYTYILKLKESYYKGIGNPHKLWLILIFQMWWFRWIK